MRKAKTKAKGKGLWNWMKRHKVVSTILCLLILCFLVMAMSLGVLLWNLNKDNVGIVDADDVDPNADEVQIAREDQKNKDVINVLLVGSDSRAYGGVGLTINTINQQFGLDVQDYVIINFENLVEIIDQLGGIQVMLTEEEAAYYRENGMPDIVAGNVTLTGSQALAHARNRSLDNDFGRTERQRDVIYGIYNKVLEQRNDPSTLLSLIQFCMTQVSTNMSVTELYEMATDVLSVDNLKTQQAAIPAEGTYEFGTYEEMSVLNIDLEANKEYIQELLY